MYNTVPGDAFFDAMPVYLDPSSKETINNLIGLEPVNNLEDEVKTEEEYLDYLFHYRKDISHILKT